MYKKHYLVFALIVCFVAFVGSAFCGYNPPSNYSDSWPTPYTPDYGWRVERNWTASNKIYRSHDAHAWTTAGTGMYPSCSITGSGTYTMEGAMYGYSIEADVVLTANSGSSGASDAQVEFSFSATVDDTTTSGWLEGDASSYNGSGAEYTWEDDSGSSWGGSSESLYVAEYFSDPPPNGHTVTIGLSISSSAGVYYDGEAEVEVDSIKLHVL